MLRARGSGAQARSAHADDEKGTEDKKTSHMTYDWWGIREPRHVHSASVGARTGEAMPRPQCFARRCVQCTTVKPAPASARGLRAGENAGAEAPLLSAPLSDGCTDEVNSGRPAGSPMRVVRASQPPPLSLVVHPATCRVE